MSNRRCDYSPPAAQAHRNIFKQCSQVQNEGLTLSFGFAVQHVLLSLLGRHVIVEAVEKILLVVHFLVAVARKNKARGEALSQLYFNTSCFPK